MKPLPRFIPVIHVESDAQAVAQAGVAFDNGADGIFLIDHRRSSAHLRASCERVRDAYPDRWLGINMLDERPANAMRVVPGWLDALWLDHYSGLGPKEMTMRRDHRIFAGTAFKYQGQPDDLAKAAQFAAHWFDVVTTSGDATGSAADVQKIRTMKEAIGDEPLALASGVTIDNVHDYLPYVTCFLVATGISKSFHELDPDKVRALADVIHAHVPVREPT